MTPKHKFSVKKIVAAGAVAGSLTLGFWASKAFYTVKQVIDGDTFITTQNQHIRFYDIDAPELSYCMGRESQNYLEKLILNKKVFLKINYNDTKNGRLVSEVYSISSDIEELMLKAGMATIRSAHGKINLTEADQFARQNKLGIYSNTCTQSLNTNSPNCNIKGNIRAGKKFYSYPECSQYNATLVQLYLGENWFCSSNDAQKAGFTKSPDCP